MIRCNAVESLSLLVMQVAMCTGAGVGQTERPSKGHYDVQEGGSGGNWDQIKHEGGVGH